MEKVIHEILKEIEKAKQSMEEISLALKTVANARNNSKVEIEVSIGGKKIRRLRSETKREPDNQVKADYVGISGVPESVLRRDLERHLIQFGEWLEEAGIDPKSNLGMELIKQTKLLFDHEYRLRRIKKDD